MCIPNPIWRWCEYIVISGHYVLNILCLSKFIISNLLPSPTLRLNCPRFYLELLFFFLESPRMKDGIAHCRLRRFV